MKKRILLLLLTVLLNSTYVYSNQFDYKVLKKEEFEAKNWKKINSLKIKECLGNKKLCLSKNQEQEQIVVLDLGKYQKYEIKLKEDKIHNFIFKD